MKPHFRPAGRWWTYDPGDRECTWASVLARSSGLSCPAPDFGAHCGRRCPAHLFHSRTMPLPEDFASGLGRREPGHDHVYYQRLGEGRDGSFPGAVPERRGREGRRQATQG